LASSAPLFYSYTSDTFLNIFWRWRWFGGLTKPHPDNILDLSPYCPKCGLRIEPKEKLCHDEVETVSGRRPRDPWYYTLYRCDADCVKPTPAFMKAIADVESHVRRLIEQAAFSRTTGTESSETAENA
jgi:hypothetical protein